VNKQCVLFDAKIELDVLNLHGGYEWDFFERENAAKVHKKIFEAFRQWSKNVLNKDNKKNLMLKLFEHVSTADAAENAFSIRLVAEYDSSYPNALEEVTALKNRINCAIKGAEAVFEKIQEKNSKNPSAVVLSLIEENENSILVANRDVLALAEELRQNLGGRKEKVTLRISDEGGGSEAKKEGMSDVTIALHSDGAVIQQDNKTEIIEVKLIGFSDEKHVAEGRFLQGAGKKYSLSWDSTVPVAGLREKLILDLRDRAVVKLSVIRLVRLRNGQEITKGYIIVDYLGRVQGELDFGAVR